jgi:hypothetical protein
MLLLFMPTEALPLKKTLPVIGRVRLHEVIVVNEPLVVVQLLELPLHARLEGCETALVLRSPLRSGRDSAGVCFSSSRAGSAARGAGAGAAGLAGLAPL